VSCKHGGTNSNINTPDNKLKLNGQSCYTTVSGTLVGCTQIGPGLTPCTTFVISTGSSIKTKISNQGCIRIDDNGTTNGVPDNTCSVTNAGQTKWKSV